MILRDRAIVSLTQPCHFGRPRDSMATPAPRRRKKTAAKKSGLTGLRSQIDTIDRELVALMNQRAEVARQIGHLKAASGELTYDPSREELVLDRVAAVGERIGEAFRRIEDRV